MDNSNGPHYGIIFSYENDVQCYMPRSLIHHLFSLSLYCVSIYLFRFGHVFNIRTNSTWRQCSATTSTSIRFVLCSLVAINVLKKLDR